MIYNLSNSTKKKTPNLQEQNPQTPVQLSNFDKNQGNKSKQTVRVKLDYEDKQDARKETIVEHRLTVQDRKKQANQQSTNKPINHIPGLGRADQPFYDPFVKSPYARNKTQDIGETTDKATYKQSHSTQKQQPKAETPVRGERAKTTTVKQQTAKASYSNDLLKSKVGSVQKKEKSDEIVIQSSKNNSDDFPRIWSQKPSYSRNQINKSNTEEKKLVKPSENKNLVVENNPEAPKGTSNDLYRKKREVNETTTTPKPINKSHHAVPASKHHVHFQNQQKVEKDTTVIQQRELPKSNIRSVFEAAKHVKEQSIVEEKDTMKKVKRQSEKLKGLTNNMKQSRDDYNEHDSHHHRKGVIVEVTETIQTETDNIKNMKKSILSLKSNDGQIHEMIEITIPGATYRRKDPGMKNSMFLQHDQKTYILPVEKQSQVKAVLKELQDRLENLTKQNRELFQSKSKMQKDIDQAIRIRQQNQKQAEALRNKSKLLIQSRKIQEAAELKNRSSLLVESRKKEEFLNTSNQQHQIEIKQSSQRYQKGMKSTPHHHKSRDTLRSAQQRSIRQHSSPVKEIISIERDMEERNSLGQVISKQECDLLVDKISELEEFIEDNHRQLVATHNDLVRKKHMLEEAREEIVDKNRMILQLRYDDYPRSVVMPERFHYWSLESSIFYKPKDPVGQIVEQRHKVRDNTIANSRVTNSIRNTSLNPDVNDSMSKGNLLINSRSGPIQKRNLLANTRSQHQLKQSEFQMVNQTKRQPHERSRVNDSRQYEDSNEEGHFYIGLLEKLKNRVRLLKQDNQSLKRGLLVK